MSHDSHLDELLLRWEELRDAGQTASAAELCRDCPELRAALEQRIEALQEMDAALASGKSRAVLQRSTTPYYSSEVQALLETRLRLAGLILLFALTLLLGVVVFHESLAAGMRWFDYLSIVLALEILGILTILLYRPRPYSLTQLRLFELAFFGVAAAFSAWSQVRSLQGDWIKPLLRPPFPENSLTIGESLSFFWFILIVIYGVFIPNTGRRCALVVGGLTLIPFLVILAIALLDESLQLLSLKDVVLAMGLYLSIAAAIAVYGSHRLSALSKEAFEARQLGQYRLKRRLGAGGMGEVYLAEHRLLRRPCAIKLIHPDRAGDFQSLQRFEREVQTMASLTHWNIVEVYDYGQADDGSFYYVMEYLPGLSLEEMVDRHGPLPAGRAVHFLRQACAALHEAHALGLVHRDIKPSNIIVCARGGNHDVVKLLDFGLVQVSNLVGASGKLTLEGGVMGTPSFMSPEQAAGKELNAQSDLYSLGATAYFLLTGVPPFDRETVMETIAAHLHAPVVRMTELGMAVPADLESVILRCLDKDPAQRFPDADHLDQALAQCACAGRWSQEDAAEWWRAHKEM